MTLALNLILVLQILSALAMVGLILLQHGQGADMGASFGSGASGSLFGATGSANFLSRSTAAAATIFFVCTLALAYFGNQRQSGGGVMGELAGKVVAPTPASLPASVPAAHSSKPAAAASANGGLAQIPGSMQPAAGSAAAPAKAAASSAH